MEPLLYERIAEIEREHWWYQGRRRVIERLLKPYLEPSGARRVLSVGCGTGEELRFLARYGAVLGIDPNEDAIHFVRSRGFGGQVRQASLTALPFADGIFDFVFALDVLEHVLDDRAALAEVWRVLKPKGLAIIAVPAYQFLWSRSDLRAHHHRRYGKGRFRRLLVGVGFDILRLTYFNTFLSLPIALAKLLSRIREPRFLAGAEVSMPPRWLNRILKQVFLFEPRILPMADFPFGISLLAITRKP